MASPFPGMDPFLEAPAYWLDFHARFINTWCEAIADALPAGYEASIGERVYLVERDPDARKLAYPDIGVSRSETSSPPPTTAAASRSGLIMRHPCRTSSGMRRSSGWRAL